VVTASAITGYYYYGIGIVVSGNGHTDGIIIDGGQVTVTGGSYIICEGGHFYILGGQVTVGGTLEVEEYFALDGEGNPYALTLGYSKATDFISFSEIHSYFSSNSEYLVKIADGKVMTDGTYI
jgi:hypothetical protein